MLYEVRIFNPKGKLKKTLSNKELSKFFWKKFYTEESNHFKKGMFSKLNSSVSKEIRSKYDFIADNNFN